MSNMYDTNFTSTCSYVHQMQDTQSQSLAFSIGVRRMGKDRIDDRLGLQA